LLGNGEEESWNGLMGTEEFWNTGLEFEYSWNGAEEEDEWKFEPC